MAKKKKKSKRLSLYSNLVNNKQAKKDARLKKRAKRYAAMPKDPWKRLLYRLNPKNFLRWLFSLDALRFFAKIFGTLFLIGVMIATGAFLYFRKDISNLDAEDLSRRIHTTVNTYTDRHGVVLWEDKGEGNYKLAVEGDKISEYMKQATVALEDKTFYSHKGVSFAGIVRAVINNIKGGSTQGGSTLTQQLVKQVFFADEAQKRGVDGIPRKIKEVILATEIERLYKKPQILTMYLNESPYGGRRNGVESAAQTYFGKSAQDLNLEEAALLAGIPNNPPLYDPYNVAGNEALIARQHKTLDAMVEMEYITKEQAEAAKKVAILDTIKPLVSQLSDIKAPHFVLEARREIESQLGVKTVRSGGLTIKTTLDYEIQKAAEAAAATGAGMLPQWGADNLAITAVDVDTAQVIAMVGSVDFTKPGYGQQNAATSLLEPGSSIKPIVDYAPLFMQRSGVNYGPGSILKDENIDSLYCAGNTGKCTIQNYTRRTYGNVTIRQSLGSSLNRPAVKAMYIAGKENAVKVAQDLGDKSYCKDSNVYLSSAIGGGCAVKQVEHANAFASFARYGKYKPISYVLEVKNSSGGQLLTWKDVKSVQAVDPQVAYMIADILADADARRLTFGGSATAFGFKVPGVWTAGKTGTTENGAGRAKDSWMTGFSTKIAAAAWLGNHDGSPLRSSQNNAVRRMFNDLMVGAHEIYKNQGKWVPGEKMQAPEGIKTMTVAGKTDIWPSWFDAKAGIKTETITFDKVSKKKATACTPTTAREDIEVSKTEDPITKQENISAPEGYDPEAEDDIHNCTDIKPEVQISSIEPGGGKDIYKVTITPKQGTHALGNMTVVFGNKTIYNGSAMTKTLTLSPTASGQNLRVTVSDVALYETTRNVIGPAFDPKDKDGDEE